MEAFVGRKKAYEHFGPPLFFFGPPWRHLILYQRLRTFQLRLLPDDELLLHEVSKIRPEGCAWKPCTTCIAASRIYKPEPEDHCDRAADRPGVFDERGPFL